MKKYTKKIIIILLMISFLAPIKPTFADSQLKEGWNPISTIQVYWVKNGIKQTGWQYIDSNWYYFDPVINNMMQHQVWIQDGNNYYYLKYDGSLATNCYVDGYYVDNNGVYIASKNNFSFGEGIYNTNGTQINLEVYLVTSGSYGVAFDTRVEGVTDKMLSEWASKGKAYVGTWNGEWFGTLKGKLIWYVSESTLEK